MTQSHVNQIYTPVPVIRNSNTPPKNQSFEDHAFVSHQHQNSNHPHSNNAVNPVPPPPSSFSTTNTQQQQQNKKEPEVMINLLDAPLAISTQTSLPNNHINNSKDPFDSLPPIELITASSTPDLSQMSKTSN